MSRSRNFAGQVVEQLSPIMEPLAQPVMGISTSRLLVLGGFIRNKSDIGIRDASGDRHIKFVTAPLRSISLRSSASGSAKDSAISAFTSESFVILAFST